MFKIDPNSPFTDSAQLMIYNRIQKEHDELKKIKNKTYRKKNTTETYTFNQIMDKYN